MKRVIIFTVIVAMYGFGACNSISHKGDLKTSVDSLSYIFGMSRTDGIMNYLVSQAGIDTNYMDAFYKGFKDGAKNYSPKDVAYLEGVRLAHMISNQWVANLNREIFMGDAGHTLNRRAMLSGFYNGIKNQADVKIIPAQSYAQIKIEEMKDDYRKTKYADLIAAGEQLLAGNKTKADVITTSSGLQYKIITEGNGEIPGERTKVKVNYRGTLVDGTEFDSSYKNNAPASFYVNGVIRGWTEALKLMPVGSKWELYIPQEMAYGAAGSMPNVPPYATLIFEIELLEIESK